MYAVQLPSMPDAILHLQGEHKHVEEQLSLLAANAECVLAGDPLEVAAMLEVLHALHDYIDEVHQPREDAALELVARRLRAPSGVIGELEHQHDLLHETGARLLDHLERIAADAPVSRRDVEADLLGFVTAMREHMALEERAFFPLAERELSAAEWAQIDAMRAP